MVSASMGDEMNKAEIHAEIAKRVYPDVFTKLCKDGCIIEKDWMGKGYMQWKEFDLLETDSNGNPTQQAKASSLDVLCWMNGYTGGAFGVDIIFYAHFSKSPCAAIFEAAKEIVTTS